MANKKHLEILKQGVDAWNQWREENPDVRPDLSRAKLRDAVLSGAKLSRANLGGAYLSGATLSRANLSGAYLIDADLINADLSGASLVDAVLSRAKLRDAVLSDAHLIRTDLSGADLSGVGLIRANLSGAGLSDAILNHTIFGNVDLSATQGLEAVNHRGPLTIGIDTIQKSKGKIPEEFLRGAGVPDGWIKYIPSLIGELQPIQYYSCFISYSHKDEDFAKRLHSRMRDEHLRVWFAPEDIQAGRKVHEQIEEAIRYYDKLLLVLSEDSMDSQWVETEIYHARQREAKEERRVLFPIRLVDFETIRDWTCFDADTGRDMAREMREYYIPDFSNWKNHDAFEDAFDRLLNALKAEDEPSEVTE